MSVLSSQFDKSVVQASPVQKDFARTVNYDENGNEIVTYVEVDYPSIQQSLGSVEDWSLSALLKAGINPNFPIHTGNSTRLDGLSDLGQFSAEADAILAEADADSNENN